ncbi:DUF4238 domain-containing protein [Enterococcus sp. DIV0187]|uniref:DUF4238 domain-containing protein n=1 Tax=Enterococcus sp. DIV0187 TaxID=2774644 RepID=UPI003F231A20
MADTKKEHYVPRFYLKDFCDTDNKIWVFDKRTQSIRKQKVTEIAMENYFYDLDLDKVTLDAKKEEEFQKISNEYLELGIFESFDQMKDFLKKGVEKDYFSKIEPLFAKLLKDISEKANGANRWYIQNCYAFSIKQKEMLSVMFANQLMRTKTRREEYKDGFEKLASRIFTKLYKDSDAEEVAVTLNKEALKWQHISMMLDPDHLKNMSDILNSHIWIMLINKTSKSFYTSDNPIAKIPNVIHPHKGNMGIGSEGMELLFPITPNLIVGMYEKEYFRGKMLDRSFVEINEPEVIDRFNSAQILSSYRCVFSKENNFELAEKLIKENPDLAEYTSNISVS